MAQPRVADKRQVQKRIRELRHVKTWQLLLLLALAVLIAATFLRLNNVGMVERRRGVVSADQAGNLEDMQNRLYDLQRYASEHMNASTGRIALENQYQRDSQKAKDAAEANGANNPNGNVYRKAAEVCDPLGISQGWRWPDPRYISCIDTELGKYPASTNPGGSIKLPSASAYYHSFASPLWSADFAGFSVLACLVISLIIIGRLLTLGILRLLLKRHYRSV